MDNELDYYNGGMVVNFSKNKLSFEAFRHLQRLLNNFSGLRSISLSHQVPKLQIEEPDKTPLDASRNK